MKGESVMENQAVIGVVGLAVMGENLALNLANHNFRTAVYNRTVSKVDDFISGRGAGKPVTGCRTIEEFTAAQETPRKILLMVKAGAPVDACIAELLPHLQPGDIIMDGGNSFYLDTVRRERELKKQGILYLGVGISGGEEGALNGPSLMPGGNRDGWPAVEPILKTIAAQVDGVPCCEWVGPEGAGHFVKMVHNGIEYADMQLIAEAYGYMRDALKFNNEKIHRIFSNWSRGELAGYLLDITSDIFTFKDPESGALLLDKILDAPGQKGTGRWTSVAALETNTPVPTLTQAVFQRNLDADKELRIRGAQLLPGAAPDESDPMTADEIAEEISALESALYCSKLCAYAQGFALLKAAEREYGWPLNYGELALLWRGGCIIRARFLNDIKAAYDREPGLENLMFDEFFRDAVKRRQDGWRYAVAASALFGAAMPATASALGYYDSIRRADSPSNLIQAQRDYFGAHTFERKDRLRGEFFHNNWTH